MEKDELSLRLENIIPRMYGVEFDSVINWTIKKGEQWAVVGLNGSGKTLLADLVCGRHAVRQGNVTYGFWDEERDHAAGYHYPTDRIRKVSFESAYLLADYKNMYYQQRFSSTENEDMPTVRELVDSMKLPEEEKQTYCSRLNLTPLLDKHIIMLSSGELRRVLIANVLMQKPALLIFDNPFIGLDKEMMVELNLFFDELAQFQQMVFLVPALNEIPNCVTDVLPAKGKDFGTPMKRAEFFASEHPCLVPDWKMPSEVILPKSVVERREYDIAVKLSDINISYPGRTLFKDLNWEIKRGEKWALLGPNGAGKSTLLSLFVGDNPRAYSQNITIFGRKRGSGESIWDIKRPIGYISSEMHLYFHEDQPCLKIIASGFFDTIGLFRKCSEEQERVGLEWMRLLGIEHLATRSFLKISGGEQRLVLLARTLVKNPDLLILDEPLHGLDIPHKQRARQVIEAYCSQPDRCLIYVTHRREEIPSCVDHFFELKKL